MEESWQFLSTSIIFHSESLKDKLGVVTSSDFPLLSTIFVSFVQVCPCDGLATCPGCNSFDESWGGLQAPDGLEYDEVCKEDGWMDVVVLCCLN